MSAKQPTRLTALHDAPADVQELARGVRALRGQNGSAAEVDDLAARLGPELASNAVAGTALLSSALLRFTMISAGVIGLSLGAWLLRGHEGSSEIATARSMPAVIEAQHQPARPAQLGLPAGPVPEIPTHAQAAVPAQPVAKAPARSAPPRARTVKPKLSAGPEAELALLGRAQALLDRDPKATLDLLDEHARSYARGVFSEEREVLALEAESKLGHKALARARAERFIAQYPRSAHARRVRTLLEPAP